MWVVSTAQMHWTNWIFVVLLAGQLVPTSDTPNLGKGQEPAGYCIPMRSLNIGIPYRVNAEHRLIK